MTESRRVIVGLSTFAAAGPEPLERLKASGLDIVSNPFGRTLTTKELLDLAPGAVALIAGLETLSRDVLQQTELRVISRCGAGLSNIDLDAARELGIKVRSTPDAPTAAVAEMTVGALIGLLRELPRMDRELRGGHWVRRVGTQVAGKTIAIVGFGRIGRRVAALLRAFGVTILAVDPALSGQTEGVEVVTLDAALARADVVTLHASGEQEILGDRALSLVKRGVMILNAARGGLIDESALCAALDDGRVGGAWLDTFSQEPYEGPLVGYPQVILTPHAASSTAECRRRMEMEAVENVLDALAPRD